MEVYKSIKVREKTHRDIYLDAIKNGMSIMDFVELMYKDYKANRKKEKHGKVKETVNGS